MNDPPQNVDFGYGRIKRNSYHCPVCKNGIQSACVYFPSVPAKDQCDFLFPMFPAGMCICHPSTFARIAVEGSRRNQRDPYSW